MTSASARFIHGRATGNRTGESRPTGHHASPAQYRRHPARSRRQGRPHPACHPGGRSRGRPAVESASPGGGRWVGHLLRPAAVPAARSPRPGVAHRHRPARTRWAATARLRALGRCRDVTSGSRATGVKVQLWDCNGAPRSGTHRIPALLRNTTAPFRCCRGVLLIGGHRRCLLQDIGLICINHLRKRTADTAHRRLGRIIAERRQLLQTVDVWGLQAEFIVAGSHGRTSRDSACSELPMAVRVRLASGGRGSWSCGTFDSARPTPERLTLRC